MSFGKKKKPTSPLLGSTAAQMEAAKNELKQPVDMPDETDPAIVEMMREQRRMAKKRKGVSSTILTGGQLGDEGYDTGTVLG